MKTIDTETALNIIGAARRYAIQKSLPVSDAFQWANDMMIKSSTGGDLGEYWEEDKGWPIADWLIEVANGDTRQGYHEWVRSQSEQASDEADQDEPYTPDPDDLHAVVNYDEDPVTEEDILDEEDHTLGTQFVELLHLKLKQNGRVDTSWGDKTPTGLARVIRRVIEEGGTWTVAE